MTTGSTPLPRSPHVTPNSVSSVKTLLHGAVEKPSHHQRHHHFQPKKSNTAFHQDQPAHDPISQQLPPQLQQQLKPVQTPSDVVLTPPPFEYMHTPHTPQTPQTPQLQRRSGKYTHPYGGMRQFAEDRAGKSGWDLRCLSIVNLDSRKEARSVLAEKISEVYKEEFVRVNLAEGKGRPKANNISAAKKTVRMIAERILLCLETKATQNMFNEVMDKGKESEKELVQLRQIHKCGTENPSMSYEQIAALASAQLNGLSSGVSLAIVNPSDTDTLVTSAITVAECGEGTSDAVGTGRTDAEAAVQTMKQALIEMRAEQVGRGAPAPLLDMNWARTVRLASERLVCEAYRRQFVPKTKVYGCRHFTRRNRVLMPCCGTFVVCRMCHIQDEQRLHEPRIEPVQTVLCMMCGEVQAKTQTCRKCGQCFGSYYCDICGITDDTPGYDLRHCTQCNVCMPGLTFHCNKCNSCVPATPDHDAVCSANVHSHDPGLHDGLGTGEADNGLLMGRDMTSLGSEGPVVGGVGEISLDIQSGREKMFTGI